MVKTRQVKNIFIGVILATISVHCYGRNVDVIINQDGMRLCINDPYQPEKDPSKYEYIEPEGLRIYIVTHSDTQCVFVAPCVAEYTIQDDRNCIVYLWPSRIVCPDDCICLDEDEYSRYIKNVCDAEILLYIKMNESSVGFTIFPHVDLLKTASEYMSSLLAEIEAQRSEGTPSSAFFWSNTYETIIHNDIMFHLFSQKLLQVQDVKSLSSQLKHLD